MSSTSLTQRDVLSLSQVVVDKFREGPTLNVGAFDASQEDVQLAKQVAVEHSHKKELEYLQRLKQTYGAHAALTIFREREAVSHQRRLPGTGLPSSLLSLEIAMGTEDKLSVDDLGVSAYETPEPPVAVNRLGVHEIVDAAN